MSLRLLVCGGRDFTDGDAVFYVLDRVHRKRGVALVIHGDARGADRLAKAWAVDRGITERGFRAAWKRPDGSIDHSAGPRRNAQMLAEGMPDACVAFPPGPEGPKSGTAGMVRLCEAAGVRVWRIGWT